MASQAMQTWQGLEVTGSLRRPADTPTCSFRTLRSQEGNAGATRGWSLSSWRTAERGPRRPGFGGACDVLRGLRGSSGFRSRRAGCGQAERVPQPASRGGLVPALSHPTPSARRKKYPKRLRVWQPSWQPNPPPWSDKRLLSPHKSPVQRHISTPVDTANETTDQKVGGSSPSERTKKSLFRRGVVGGGVPLGWVGGATGGATYLSCSFPGLEGSEFGVL